MGTERWKGKSRKSLTNPKRTRRTRAESKTWLTNSRSKSRPTNDRPKKLKNKLTPTLANSENFSTNLMNLKNELIWPNLLLTRCDPKPETPGKQLFQRNRSKLITPTIHLPK